MSESPISQLSHLSTQKKKVATVPKALDSPGAIAARWPNKKQLAFFTAFLPEYLQLQAENTGPFKYRTLWPRIFELYFKDWPELQFIAPDHNTTTVLSPDLQQKVNNAVDKCHALANDLKKNPALHEEIKNYKASHRVPTKSSATVVHPPGLLEATLSAKVIVNGIIPGLLQILNECSDLTRSGESPGWYFSLLVGGRDPSQAKINIGLSEAQNTFQELLSIWDAIVEPTFKNFAATAKPPMLECNEDKIDVDDPLGVYRNHSEPKDNAELGDNNSLENNVKIPDLIEEQLNDKEDDKETSRDDTSQDNCAFKYQAGFLSAKDPNINGGLWTDDIFNTDVPHDLSTASSSKTGVSVPGTHYHSDNGTFQILSLFDISNFEAFIPGPQLNSPIQHTYPMPETRSQDPVFSDLPHHGSVGFSPDQLQELACQVIQMHSPAPLLSSIPMAQSPPMHASLISPQHHHQ
ncbi:hypothetical protein CONPUDRAFT_72361 [Coniophora puteana RWD-64-598 SS2]|uniref:Uncharacterized protein n=1 Tax=Coniophora puteana (strain RWD-64-598) TaxID=741705 RepID=A0A5M3MSF7_CONPW|nr:uncharacterized protein CONPUDRAFT_72361 [Coniophora puteana RWD-64-598 SS2]EIW82026.1 hypothetical protein CONPUDRAFT_72361 [Coniophora puteana RWD-64-598 SS2]